MILPLCHVLAQFVCFVLDCAYRCWLLCGCSQTNAAAKGTGSVVSHVSVSSHVDKPMHLPNITGDKPGVLIVEKAVYPASGGGGGGSLLPTGAILRGQITDRR